MSRITVLTFVGCYLPGYKYGGQLRTIVNMVERLGDEFHFKIITSDRDVLDSVPYPDITVNTWTRVGKADVYYVPPGQLTFRHLRRIIQATPHDIVYLNSFLAPAFTIKPLLLRRLGLLSPNPVVLAPRGEFSRGALDLKALKKKIYVALAKIAGLYRDVVWQASSEYEADDIRRNMNSNLKIKIAPDLSCPIASDASTALRPRQAAEALRIVFLSRISPMKNLDFALRVLATIKTSVQFDIYGSVADKAYWKQCRALIDRLPAHVHAHYHGIIDHANVAKVLGAYDLFFLPTRGENYGHAIYEALAAGVPALISDQTPWQDLQKEGVGWTLPLDNITAYAKVIDNQARLNASEMQRQSGLAQAYANNIAVNDATVSRNRRLFADLISARDTRVVKTY